jgi:hypothetical protein
VSCTEHGFFVGSRGRERASLRNCDRHRGGLEIAAEQGGDAIIIANAAVIVGLDDSTTG